jgi:2Fe-2S ferredoxin
VTRVKYIEFDGTEHDVEAVDGRSLMQAAVDNRIDGILGDCGGNCACGTCHGYIDPEFLGLLDPVNEDERAMLSGTLDPQPNSRLTCQLYVKPSLAGLVVRLPKSQL